MVYTFLTIKFRFALMAIVAVLLVFYAIFLRQYQFLNTLQVMYAIFIIFLGMLPGIVVLINKCEAGLIPLMPLHGIFYAITFGLPILTNQIIRLDSIGDFPGKIQWVSAYSSSLSMALGLTILGQIFLYIGYYGSTNICLNLRPLKCRNISTQQQLRFSWILFGIYCLLKIFPALQELPSVNQMSTPLQYISLGILALLTFDNKLSRWHLIFFSIALFYTIIITLTSGSLAPLIMLIIFFGVLYWINKRRIPWFLIVTTAIIIILLNPIKQQFRETTWYSQDKTITIDKKMALLAGVVEKHYSGKSIPEELAKDRSVVNRVAHISLFAYTVHATPKYIPYWTGDTYRTLWTSYIPRILWPGKPQATIGQDFGHRYFLLQNYDRGTSINLPWLIEFYINFGVLGVLAGMLFVGVFFRILLQKFRVPNNARIECALAVAITFSLFNAESNFSLMVGGMLPAFIVFIILIRMLTRESIKNQIDNKRQ